MAMTVPFDTLDYARKLEQTGVPAAQAAEQSRILADVLGKSVAFPGDLISLEHNVTAKVEAAELKIQAKLAGQAGDINLLKWMAGTLIAMNVAIMVKLFLR